MFVHIEALFGLSTNYMTTHEPALIAVDFGMWLIIVFLFTRIYMRQPKPDWQNAQREPLLMDGYWGVPILGRRILDVQ